MAEQNQTDERWRELAELLGVPAGEMAPAGEKESAPPPSAPPRAVEPPAPPAREVEVERPSAAREEEQPRLEPVAEEAPPAWESEFDENDDDTAIDESLFRDEPAGEEPAELESEGPAAAPGEGAGTGEEDRPRRGRRRRRRGRRGGREGEERAPQGSEPRRQEREPQGGEPRRQEREPRRPAEPDQRGRRRDEERRAAPARQERGEPAHADTDERPPPRPAPSLDAADDTDFSNWNVPSWQELIASLYRPDR